MGVLRRWIGSLFGRTPLSAEEVVFERIDGAEIFPDAPAAVIGRSVSIDEIFSRTPIKWRRAMDGVDSQVIVLPPQALLSAGGERPQAYSLRYLAKHYPSVFRDPGIHEADPGVDLPMEFLKDPEQDLSALPIDAVREATASRSTFAVADEDSASSGESVAEMRETSNALKNVRLPMVGADVRAAGFDDLLAKTEAVEQGQAGFEASGLARTRGVEDKGVANPRLRRILAAYAETLPEFQKSNPPAAATVRSPESQDTVGASSATPSSAQASSVPSVRAKVRSSVAPELDREEAGLVPARPGGVSFGVDATRFEELGQSLSRFMDVRGFALWQAGGVMQAGEMGFDADASGMRARLERMLEGGIQVRGEQDGFCSVTLNGAKGGISVFGGGGGLVAVAHREEGIPEHLRLWLCGWVSQSRQL
jgi:hypothetical protein